MAAPQFGASATPVTNNTANASTVFDTGLPTRNEDDLIVVTIARAATSAAITPPSDFREVNPSLLGYATNSSLYAAIKVATASEPSTYTFSWSGNSRNYGEMFTVTGADPTNIPAAEPTGATGDSATPGPPASGTVALGDYLSIAVVGQEGKGVTRYTEPSGYTLRADNGGTGSGNPNTWDSVGVATNELSAITAETPGTFASTQTDGWGAFTILIATGGPDTFALDFTTDAIKKEELELSHSSDAIKQETLTEEHTTDAIVRANITLDYITDGLLQGTETEEHTTDAIKREEIEQSHTTDAVTPDRLTLDHTTDAITPDRLTGEHTTDAITPDRLTQEHTTDAILLEEIEQTHTTDAILLEEIEQTHTTDAITPDRLTVDHTTDAITPDRLTVDHTTDAIVQAQAATVEHTTDAIKASDLLLVTHTTDAIKFDGATIVHTTDAFLTKTVSPSTNFLFDVVTFDGSVLLPNAEIINVIRPTLVAAGEGKRLRRKTVKRIVK
jgi:hypothetical protein